MATEDALRQWVSDRLAEKETEHATFQRKHHEAMTTIQGLEEVMSAIEMQMAMYRDFLRDAEGILGEKNGVGGLPNPTDAVAQLVEEEPGIKRYELLNRLNGRVKSSSADPRGVISAAVSRGKKEKRYFESKGHGIWLFDHPDAVAIRETDELDGFLGVDS